MVKKLAQIGWGLPLLVGLSCSQIVGITDTDVTSGTAGSADPGTGGSSNPGGSGKTGVGGSQSNDGGTDSAAAGGSAGADATSHAGAGMSTGGMSTGGTATGGSATGGTANGGSQAGGGSGGGGAAAVLHGPKLIDVDGYSVDATEVTVSQYKEFLKAKAGDTSGQIPACSWNKSFYEVTSMPANPDAWPISNVDWCDANAFCAWAGKRLCGAIAGGAVDFADFLEPTKSEWFRACGGPLGQPHPNTCWACNDKGGGSDLAAVATFPGCEGFETGVFDMEANASEWVDSCDGSTGKTDHCISAGGSEIDNQAFCNETAQDVTRDFTSAYFGFRCCSK